MAKRVYFAFHYQDVIDFRANVVRNHHVLKGIDEAGYYDHSIWEESKKKGDMALKRMINSELLNSSVTAVLIGSNTYARRWVRYELMQSMARGNAILGVHINGVKGKDGLTKTAGPNPFDYIGIQISDDGTRGRPTEWNGTQWVFYSDVDSFSLKQQPLDMRGKNYQLSRWFRTHDWAADDGYNNFSNWIA